jgi:hypothetical protein
MVLAHDFIKAARPQFVCKRTWRIALEPGS